jgi:putative ABC transport system ATP-binding protein
MGPSGSGKSTLLHIIGCLDSPDSGEVLLKGRRVEAATGRALTQIRRNEVGFIFQGYNLVPSLNALENIALAAEYAGQNRRDSHKLAMEALEAVGMADRAKHLPAELSGGQQQRAAIARALVNRPSVLLGDEPTGNLDSANSAEVMGMMRDINLATGTTFVLVTHNPEVADQCDRVIEVRDGVVVDDVSRNIDPRIEVSVS